jgi:hypothetical protein
MHDLRLLKSLISLPLPSGICFITLGWAVYPCPQSTVVRNGRSGEFKCEFKEMYKNYGIIAKPTSGQNPQANAIIEKIHKVVNEMFR